MKQINVNIHKASTILMCVYFLLLTILYDCAFTKIILLQLELQYIFYIVFKMDAIFLTNYVKKEKKKLCI